MTDNGQTADRDWVSGIRTYLVAWGLPSIVLVAAIWTSSDTRTIAWGAALIWMGSACLLNSRRCGRVHCRYTGPFFLVMALVVGLHGSGAVTLGPGGWIWIGSVVVLGTAAIWIVSERLEGRYRRPEEADP
jgi:hypothetical protein